MKVCLWKWLKNKTLTKKYERNYVNVVPFFLILSKPLHQQHERDPISSVYFNNGIFNEYPSSAIH